MLRMGPYTLTVFHKGSLVATEVAHAKRAAEVMMKIKELLDRHHDCHRLRVEGPIGHLFTVDCKGDRVDD